MKKTKRKVNMISVALWVAALMVVGTVVIGKTAQYRKTKMVADKYTEAVRMMPALSNSIGVRLDSDKQHDSNVLLDFIGCYGVVLRDGSVMMAECDLENIRYDKKGMPYDMNWTPRQSDLDLILHPGLPREWRGTMITLIPNQENDGTWFYVGVGLESEDGGYGSMLWYWSSETEEYLRATIEIDLSDLDLEGLIGSMI